jgi:hypothetical protein
LIARIRSRQRTLNGTTFAFEQLHSKRVDSIQTLIKGAMTMATKTSAPVGLYDINVNGLSEVKWFAGIAMQAMIAKQGIPESQSAREEIALWALRMAQAMVDVGKQLLVEDPSDVDPEC